MIVMLIIMSACVGILLYMWKQAYENNIRMHEVLAPGAGQVHNLFFISDTHARKINASMIQRITEPIDAVIIGGDFVDRRTSEKTLIENIRLLKTLGPVYFVWGNNDNEYEEQQLRNLFLQHGVTILENTSATVKKELYLSAVKYSVKKQNIPAALAGCDLERTVFIAHNPEHFSQVFKHYEPLLTLGGHLHGGQIRFGKWGVQPHGYFKQIGKRYELVSNGYGTSLVPLRLGAKPECHVIRINFEQNKTPNEI